MPPVIDQIIRTKRRTISLIVESDGTLVVRAPLRASEVLIRGFVESKQRWIERKQAEARLIKPPPANRFVSGETYPYLGKNYPLEVLEKPEKSFKLVDHFELSGFPQVDRELALQKWYRRQARRILTERVAFYAARYDLPYEKIRISSARTRWGSCSGRGSLSFTWRLVQTPLEVIDYVVVHELVHTLFHNHSKRFWRRVAKILPDYREQYRWLQKNGNALPL
jgi:predicted metal-dependent hydrolase